VRRPAAYTKRPRSQRKRGSGKQAQAASAQRSPHRHHLSKQQRAASHHERYRGKRSCFTHTPAERHRQAVTNTPPIPMAVQHESHEHSNCHEAQPKHVALALIEYRPTKREAVKEPS
jgi:hypothetical protein